MIKQGIYIDSNGNQYNTYEIDMEKFYRFDIIQDGAQFHLDPDAVLYSIVKRKKQTYVFGNHKLKDAIEGLKDRLKFAKLPIKPEIFWEDGRMCRTQMKGDTDAFFYKVTERAGVVDEEVYRDGQAMFYTFLATSGSEVEMIPFNIDEYQCADIGEGAFVGKSPIVSLEVLKSRFN